MSVKLGHDTYWKDERVLKRHAGNWLWFWRNVNIYWRRRVDGKSDLDQFGIGIEFKPHDWSWFHRYELPDCAEHLESGLVKGLPGISLIVERPNTAYNTFVRVPTWAGWTLLDMLKEITQGIVAVPEKVIEPARVQQGAYR